MNKTEFESRISFNKITLRAARKPAYEASVFWGGKLYETIKYTKELCVLDLAKKAGVILNEKGGCNEN
jgi:hypothetical protein